MALSALRSFITVVGLHIHREERSEKTLLTESLSEADFNGDLVRSFVSSQYL